MSCITRLKRACAFGVVSLSALASMSCQSSGDESLGSSHSFIQSPVYSQQAYVKAPNTGAGDAFSVVAVSDDGNTMAVGAPYEAGASNTLPGVGVVYVYVRSGSTWSHQKTVRPLGGVAGIQFGSSVSLSADGNVLVIGAPYESSLGDSNGAFYVARRTGVLWSTPTKFTSPNADAFDYFGGAVEVSGDGNTLVVSAVMEDGSGTFVTPGATGYNNGSSMTGAAYVYVWSGTAWSLQKYIKATNTGFADLFGYGLSLSYDGNTFAVGAPGESSAGTGVGSPTQSDDSASGAGAVYVYTRSGVTWSHQAYIKASNTGTADTFGFDLDLSGDGNTLVVGAYAEDGNGILFNNNPSDNSANNAGAVYLYNRSGGSWSFQSYVKAPNTEASDKFGSSVTLSADGTTFAVVAEGEDSAEKGVGGLLNNNGALGAGAVYTYHLVNGSWSYGNYVKASNTDAGDELRYVALSADGTTLAMSARKEDSAETGVTGTGANNGATDSGAVYVLTSTLVPTYASEAYVKASNPEVNDAAQTVAVSDDGNTFVLGAPAEDSNAVGIGGDETNNASTDSGAAYVFARSGGSWLQEAYVKASNTEAGDGFGVAAALSTDGDTLVVGAPGEDSALAANQGDNTAAGSGAVYVFTRSAGVWTQQAYIKASNIGAGDQFGAALALSDDGNTLVVGAPGEASNALGSGGNQANNSASGAGAVYVLTRSAGAWSQQAYLKSSNTGATDGFGSFVALSSSGDTLGISAPGEDSGSTLVTHVAALTPIDNAALGSGAAYVWQRSGSAWTQQAYVKSPSTEAGDALSAIALSGDGSTLALGAPGEDSNSMLINGPVNNSALGSGAAYVYTRSGSTWSYQTTLKASNTEADDAFGGSLALSSDGTTLAIGASAEDSAVTGVNGNRANNSALSSGAVFTFKRSGSTWVRGDYVKASNTDADDLFGRSSPALSSDGNTLVVAAEREDSSATGVNGNPGNDLDGDNSGAAYVYAR